MKGLYETSSSFEGSAGCWIHLIFIITNALLLRNLNFEGHRSNFELIFDLYRLFRDTQTPVELPEMADMKLALPAN